LVLRGDAGIGKTALLDYLIAVASDMTVLRAVGVESEVELAYASLHQLCRPLLEQLERLERLPAPQRQALEVVFGLGGGPPPDRFLVGLGLMSLLSDAAQERALLCVVDDAQWLDRASALTLPFVARRLLAEPIGMVFATRESDDELQHLPELELHGLVNGDARALLQSAVRFRLDEGVRDRIVVETRGNPLALLELPRDLTATELAGGFGLPETHVLTGRIEQSFVSRFEALPEETRSLLLVAAAEPVGDPVLLWRATEQLGIEQGAVDAAERAGLVAIGERVSFRHPLVRSAVYGSATAPERRTVHVALAEATDADADPDRRAWHLAAAAGQPDEEVASELQHSASRAQARGGLAAAAAFLQRAVALTPDPARRAERALAAALASFQAGAFDAALQLVGTAEAGRLDEFLRAQADLLRAHVAFTSRYGSDAAPLLLKAARRLEPFDLELARRTYLMAWGAAVAAGHLGGGGDVLIEVCHAVRALPPPAGAPHPLDLLLDGIARLTIDGRAVATPILQRAATAIVGMPADDVLRWGPLAATASTAVWDSDGSVAILERHAKIVRDAGALMELPLHLAALADVKARNGDFTTAELLLAESDSTATVTGSQVPPIGVLSLRALRGSEAEARSIEATIAQAELARQGELSKFASWAAAMLYNGLARYDEAMSAARRATENALGPWASVWALPELVEAAAYVGDLELARDALEQLVETTQPAGTDLALGIEARSRALLSDGAAAGDLHREAIERLGRTRRRPELARAHLLYGEWLRRQRRRTEAREQLRTAYTMFVDIGMEAFAERTRRELLATGVHVQRRVVETRDDLTAQERQIALLARDGMSNIDIGAQLSLSQHTVAYHLRKVFSKLGIRSRRELAAALPSSGSELAPA
jgi:DNA-binding CsgD family transcriptional regulator